MLTGVTEAPYGIHKVQNIIYLQTDNCAVFCTYMCVV